MDRLPFLVALLALPLQAGRAPASPGGPAPDGPGGPGGPGATPFELKEEALTLEYTAEVDEAVLRLSAESEQELGFVQVLDPGGELLLQVDAEGAGRRGLSGFELELDECSGRRLAELYREGTYEIEARSLDGHPATGRASLSFELPPAPRVLHPFAGARVPADEVVVAWEAAPGVSAYRIVLEQDENDGLTLVMPPGTSSLRVPAGFLRPGTATQLEVAAVAENGNATLVEIPFTTR